MPVLLLLLLVAADAISQPPPLQGTRTRPSALHMLTKVAAGRAFALTKRVRPCVVF